MSELKLVKMAHIQTLGEFIEIVHYDTVIVRYNPKTKKAHIQRDLSPTSNKQIQYFIEAFNPQEIINDNEGYTQYDKNEFSRPLN